jgi:protein ImuB
MWSIDLIQRKYPPIEKAKGLLLVDKIKGQTIVVRACNHAKSIGVKEGINITLAKAFLPTAQVESFDALSDYRALYKTAVWAIQFTPLVGIDLEIFIAIKTKKLKLLSSLHDGLILDITGTDRLYGSEENLVHRIFEKLSKARFRAKIAIARTIGAAWALSRFSSKKFISVGVTNLEEMLLPLPICSLRIDAEHILSLQQVGIDTINKLLKIPRSSLNKRYGTSVSRKIDEALGYAFETYRMVKAPYSWLVKKEYDYPLKKHYSIQNSLLSLLSELIEKLNCRKKKAKNFTLFIQGLDEAGVAYRSNKTFSLYSASQNEGHLISIISPLIESLSIPGPAYLLMLSCKHTEEAHSNQANLFKDTLQGSGDELLNALTVRLGEEHVTKPIFHESYVPEKSYSFVALRKVSKEQTTPNEIANRPSCILTPPEEITAIAMLPDHPPSQIRWKNSNYLITQGYGPERIGNEWWKDKTFNLSEREYFRVQDNLGRWLWLFRNRKTHKWFIQGMWV